MCGMPCAVRRITALGPLAAAVPPRADMHTMPSTANARPIQHRLPPIRWNVPDVWCAGRGRWWPAAGLRDRSGLLVLPELLAHHAADLADRAVLGERRSDRYQQVAVAASDLTQLVEPPVDRVL